MRPPLVLVGGGLLAACTPTDAPAPLAPDGQARLASSEKVQPVRSDVLIVELDLRTVPAIPEDVDLETARQLLSRRDVAIARTRDAWALSLPHGVRILATYDHFPLVSVRVDDPSLRRQLLRHPAVRQVYDEEVFLPSDASALAQIGQPTAQTEGAIGAGTSIAVLDTGANYTHPDFGSCSAVGVPASCRVVYAADFASEDGSLDAHGHGTNVTATAGSVAPGADLIPLDVFTGGSAYGSHILQALDWVVTNRATYDIAAVNLSLGSGRYTAPCSNYFAAALDTVVASGVLVAAASGNDAWSDAIASPACNASAFSVGAVYDAPFGSLSYSACSDANVAAGDVTCFSNGAAFLDLLAPGSLITNGGYTMAGTSQAAPHVAGAAAVLRAAWPDATVGELEQLLVDGGVSTSDDRNSLVFPRLDLAASLALVPSTEPPLTGTLAIDGGASATADPWVTLTLDAPEATEVCISNTADCSDWQPATPTLGWRLTAGAGPKTVRAWFRDDQRLHGPVSATILYDDEVPTAGSVTATPGDGALTLSWAGFVDAQGPLDHYEVHVLAGARRTALSCTGTPAAVVSGTTTLITGLTNGVEHAVAVCGVDSLGNRSDAARTSGIPAPESAPPEGSFQIDHGAPSTSSRVVSIQLAATDPSGVSEACISDRYSSCHRWFPMTDEASYTLPDRPGTVALFARFRDPWGQESTVAEQSILLDNRAPRDGLVSLSPTLTGVQLELSGFLDGETSIVGYEVYASEDATPPADCGSEPVWSGDATTVDLMSPPGTTRGYRVCAVDALGNRSAGVTASGGSAPETDGPTATLLVAGGASWVTDPVVSIDLQASDPSGVADVCITTRPTCSTWRPYPSGTPLSLPDIQGEHTVRAVVRDVHGNRTELLQTIGYDALPPLTGALTVQSLGDQLVVRWPDAHDEGSGLAEHRLFARQDALPEDCSGTPSWSGTGEEAVLPVPVGSTWGLRLCTTDVAGNTRSVTGQAIASVETDPPSLDFLLAGGATQVDRRSVSVELVTSDASGPVEACLSRSALTCSGWRPADEVQSYDLPNWNGTWTVFAHVRDVWGNSTHQSATVQLLLD